MPTGSLYYHNTIIFVLFTDETFSKLVNIEQSFYRYHTETIWFIRLTDEGEFFILWHSWFSSVGFRIEIRCHLEI